MASGEPLQLIEFTNAATSANDEEGGIQLNHDNLDQVLSKTENRPLCIICVCGPSRQGKSFLLGHMIRCLEGLEKDESDWMDWQNKDKPLTGFKFRNGTSPETQGIWVWSKPFLITVGSGSEDKPVAVLLVDTQGTYDEFTSSRTMASIVGISLLMSSSMIFNFFKNLQEDVLTSLEHYTNYGQLVQKECNPDEVGKAFQKLTFLIRDWNNPGEHAYGSKGGKTYLEQKLEIKDEQSPEAKSIRKTIKSCFETLDCYLMPSPGENAITPGFKGSIAELNVQFAKKLEDFISNNLINPDDLGTTSLKRILGNEVTATELRTFLDLYISIFNSREMSTPLSMAEATKQVVNQNVIQKCVKQYQETVKARQRKQHYFSESVLSSVDSQAKNKALSAFKNARKFGNAETIQELQEELEKALVKELQLMRKQNDEKRSKYIDTEMASALKQFRDDLETDFPFDPENPLEFYEEAKLKKVAKNSKEEAVTDFNEKFESEDGDDEDAIKSINQALIHKLDNVLNEILMENKLRQEAAEKLASKMIEEVISEYTGRMRQFLDDNEYADDSQLQEEHSKVKAKSPEELTMRLKSNKTKLTETMLKNLQLKLETGLEESFESIKAEHTVRLQESQKAADKLIQDLVDNTSNQMNAFEVAEELEEFHKENLVDMKKMFADESPFPPSSSPYLDCLDILLKKLETSFEARDQEIAQKKKASEQAFKDAIEQEFNTCHGEMTKTLQSVPFLSSEDLRSKNDELVFQALQNLQNLSLANPSEARNNLTSRLVEDFERFRIQNDQQKELASTKAQNLASDCQGEYQGEMKVEMEKVKTEAALKSAHKNARTKAVESFKFRCEVKDSSFQEKFISDLENEIDEAFEEILELFELKMGEEEGVANAAIVDARQLYDEEMSKHFSNHDFIRPDHLDKLHDEVSLRCVEKCNAKAPLTSNQKTELAQALLKSFQKFKEQNDMNLDCDEVAIGIDLGTTYSCVAVYIGGKTRVIQNSLGKNTTPSYVSYREDGSEMVGDLAKQRAYENPENTIFDAKRIIGRKFDDPALQGDMRLWPFTVVDDGGVPKLEVRGKKLHPEQISARVLLEMKNAAEKYLVGKTVTKAVITVPAYFTDGQRQATIHAGELAGLEVLKILTEPVAAAMAYKKQHSDTFGDHTGSRNILIFDLGGGTFDVAVLKSTHGELEVLVIDGNDHLGGEDFDKNLMQHCADEFKRTHGIDLFADKDSTTKRLKDDCRRRLRRLQMECERKKIDLASARRVEVSLDSMCAGKDLNVVLTRDKFEQLNEPQFRETVDIVDRALKHAKLEKNKIDDIVLVGGSTRIPKIQELLRSYFGGKALDNSINPDEAVAWGAAMQAALMNGAIAKDSIDFTKIQDVTPMSIGVEVYGGGFSVIIPKSTKIPVKAKERYKTAHNNQTSVQVTIYQGEEAIAVNNVHLGDFYLNGIPPRDAELENIDVEMVINSQGILHVNAVASSTGRSTGISVTENKQRMSKATIKRLLAEASPA